VRGHHLDLPDLPRFPSRVEAGARRPEVKVADDKPYQSLYRKYRPQGPSEVLGQDHVIRALSGAVREGRLAHAFLLCGPRGTGKTSTARILAKMVNCESGPTPEPCGSCDQCVAVRDGQHLDVVEIDAASHGGVDDARDLREKAPTAPVQGREKVYIIDEAQRLSREAFDALLKVFEEPPAGVRFVLATTEPHKMPATIVGRCQRFDFRRVPVEAVAEHLVSNPFVLSHTYCPPATMWSVSASSHVNGAMKRGSGSHGSGVYVKAPQAGVISWYTRGPRSNGGSAGE